MPTTSTNRPKRTKIHPHTSSRRTYKRRSMSRRRKGCLYFIAFQTALVILLIIVGIVVIWQANSQSHDRTPITHLHAYVLPVKPSVSVDFINQVLDYYHSPAAGKGQALYDDGVKYGIDPVYALAFFMQESTFGTQGIATVTHSLGNIRANSGDPQYHGYRMYSTWEAGFADWYKLMARQYIGQWKLTTVDQIVPIYAPGSDNNDVTTYISNVKNAVDVWHSGAVGV
jgi:hypothetical protein